MDLESYEQDKALAQWVRKQRHFHDNDKTRLDRKGLLDEIDKLWHQQYEQLVEFRRKNGHCMVLSRCKCSSL
jgi:hypothetical protein